VTLAIGAEQIELLPDDVVVQRTPKAGMVVASEGDVLVGIETTLTPELVAEGLARECVSRIQAKRKESNFDVTQRITITFDVLENAELKSALEKHSDYIQMETLSSRPLFATLPSSSEVYDLNGCMIRIDIQKRDNE